MYKLFFYLTKWCHLFFIFLFWNTDENINIKKKTHVRKKKAWHGSRDHEPLNNVKQRRARSVFGEETDLLPSSAIFSCRFSTPNIFGLSMSLKNYPIFTENKFFHTFGKYYTSFFPKPMQQHWNPCTPPWTRRAQLCIMSSSTSAFRVLCLLSSDVLVFHFTHLSFGGGGGTLDFFLGR